MTCQTENSDVTNRVGAPLRLKIERTRSNLVVCFRTTKDLLPDRSAYKEGRYRRSDLPGLSAVMSSDYDYRPDLQFMLREILTSEGVDHIMLRKYEVNVAFNPVFELPEVYANIRDIMLTYLPRDSYGQAPEGASVEVTDCFDASKGIYRRFAK